MVAPILDNYAHELLARLAESGFLHKVHSGKPNHLLKLPPYDGKGPKEFWALHSDRTVSIWYLLALLLQAENEWSVTHGLKHSDYQLLVTGKAPKRKAFRFGDLDRPPGWQAPTAPTDNC